MAGQAHNRRLSAVLMADIAGYTKLVEQDTDGTVAAWNAARETVIDPEIAKRAGRIVKYTGDGFLAEFPNVQDAVECAIAMQAGLADSPLDFRMGVNLGDVVDDGTDIHGEGVNIAARIEALAAPGGICLSGMVYDSVRNRIDTAFADIGEHEVKHVSAPVRVYRFPAEGGAETIARKHIETDKPSIAVLPFQNMSGDPEQEFFADGMAEDIITGLSKFHWILVIARNSTFVYKGQAVDVRAVAKDLSVRYVLEGSTRQAGNRIRITAQLIDAETGSHLWAERFDRSLDDIFDVQDEVTAAIIGAIAPEIDQAEFERSKRSHVGSLDAWGLVQRGIALYGSGEESELEEAIDYFDRARELDPNFADAAALAAYARLRLSFHFYVGRGEALNAEAAALIHEARRQDRDNTICLVAQGWLHNNRLEKEAAIECCREAIQLNPNWALAYQELGFLLMRTFSPEGAEESLDMLDVADRLNPRDPRLSARLGLKALAYFELERYAECVEYARRSMQSVNPRYWSLAFMIAGLHRMGDAEAIKEAKPRLFEMRPNFTISDLIPRVSPKIIAALRETDLPE